MMVAPVNQVLGLTINMRLLTVGVPHDFLNDVISMIRTTWGQHRKTFVVSEAKTLTGKLNHIRFGAPWLKFLLGHIYSSLAHALQWNQAHLVRTNYTFWCALKAAQMAPATPDGNVQCAFYIGTTTWSVHHNKIQHFIDRNTA